MRQGGGVRDAGCAWDPNSGPLAKEYAMFIGGGLLVLILIIILLVLIF